MASKINQLLNNWPSGTVALQSWLNQKGVNRQLAREYCSGQWLRRIGHGAYIRHADKVDWKGAVYALQNHADLSIWPGGLTALSLQGFAHYLPVTKETVHLFAAPGTRLPSWMQQHNWGVRLSFHSTSMFGKSGSGEEHALDIGAAKFGDFSIRISSLERATFELLYLVSDKDSFIAAAEIVEGLTVLRPAVIEAYLKACRSVKVNRLVLFLADHYQHTWLKRINREGINLGSGKRQIVKDGILDKKYQITVPRELMYESG